MISIQDRAAALHQNVPPNWYVNKLKGSRFDNPLHKMWHKVRFREVSEMVDPLGGVVLDIGCADGVFSKVVFNKRRASKFIGIDVLPKSISFAKRRFARSKKMSFRIADAHNLPFREETFNLVVCLEAMEHFENPRKVIEEIRRVLVSSGDVIILVPAENWLFRTLWPIWELGPGKIWKGTHLNHFSGDQIVELMKQVGFEISDNHKFWFGMLQAVKGKKRK
ncbi:MAG: methyltransferase domain-containing protein [bacterium]|nr:methyltransferase domain-containing protein [bacterium]